MTANGILKSYFGYDTFRSGQREIIDCLTGGKDAVCIMPTGSGKSVCYQIPALMLEGTTIIISPLIALMKDQVNSLQMHGVSVAYLNSSLDDSDYFSVLEDFKNGKYKILYVAPERLGNQKFVEVCRNCKIPLVVVDEAHCISQWGQDFRPDYLKISQFINSLKERPAVGAFTATATPKVKNDIIKYLKLNNPFILVNGFDRPNLFFKVVRSKNKNRDLLKLLATRKDQSGIIYCATRKLVEKVTELLNFKGYKAAMYHAGLNSEIRKRAQEDFVYDRVKIIVATNAFGMGIDKSNVSFVIHYNMPRSIESYYQEAGRAGRDGKNADCIMLYSYGDYSLNEYLISFSEQKERGRDFFQYKENEFNKLKIINKYCLTDKCLRSFILNYFDERSQHYCGHCGNCVNVEKIDVTLEARILLSCIIKTNNKFGISTIINVVRGSKNKKILAMGLDKQSTYGLLAKKSEDFLRAVLESLICDDVLTINDDSVLVANDYEKIKEIFNEQVKCEINYSKKDLAAMDKNDDNYDAGLFAKLKNVRTSLAAQLKVPAYVVFSDATLAEMCKKRPQTRQELLDIPGVGTKKLEMFGDQFLQAIIEYNREEKDEN